MITKVIITGIMDKKMETTIQGLGFRERDHIPDLHQLLQYPNLWFSRNDMQECDIIVAHF